MGAIQEKELTQFTRIDLEAAAEKGIGTAATDAKSLAIAHFLTKIDLATFDKNVKSIRVYASPTEDGSTRYRFAFTHYLPPSVVKVRDMQVREATLKDEIVAIEKRFSEARQALGMITSEIKLKREELGKVQSAMRHLATPAPNRVKHKPGQREKRG
jgi:hypothetical protein